MKPITSLLVPLLGLCSLHSQADVCLVGDSTYNGNFETGLITPWTGSGFSTGTTNPKVIAYDGNYFGTFFAAGNGGTISCTASISLPISLSEGNTINVNFQAVTVESQYALDTLTIRLLDGSSIVYLPLSISGTLSTNWGKQDYSFILPSSFNDSSNSTLQITMGRATSVSSTKYASYIDAAFVTQTVPEPSSFPFFAIGSGLLALTLRKLKTGQASFTN